MIRGGDGDVARTRLDAYGLVEAARGKAIVEGAEPVDTVRGVKAVRRQGERAAFAARGKAQYGAVQRHSIERGVEVDAPRVALGAGGDIDEGPRRERHGAAARARQGDDPAGGVRGPTAEEPGAAAHVDAARGNQLDLAGGNFDDGGDVDLSRRYAKVPPGAAVLAVAAPLPSMVTVPVPALIA